MDNNDLNDLKCKFDYEFLFSKCQEIRDMVLKSIYYAQSGHPGGALSCVECLVMLYYCFLEITPQNFYDHMRNHFILSKVHAAPTLYSILADMGFFSISDLNTLRSIDSHLQGHPDKLKTNGVECSTGSLGMGLSVSVGIG